MSSEDTSSVHDEPEKFWGVWLYTNLLVTVVGVLAIALLGYVGYFVTTNGYEVSGGIVLIASITLGCHIAELARTLYLRKQGLAPNKF